MITLIVFAAIAASIAGILLYAGTRPGSFWIRRSTRIQAAPEKIFPFINDLHLWGAWSPYEKLDPALRRDFSGNASGVGAVYAWEGNSRVGAGRMEIIQSSRASRITIELEFLRPMKGHNIVEFILQRAAGGTEVTWEMDGPIPFMGKLMGLFISMDKLVGEEFARGLANLKALVEQPGALEPAQLLRPARYNGATASNGVAAM
jgi:hypothetical protein